MFLTFHRVDRIPVLPALAAAGVLAVVGGIAVTTLAILGIVALGSKLLRAFGLVEAERRLGFQPDEPIEGIVVNRSSAGGLH